MTLRGLFPLLAVLAVARGAAAAPQVIPVEADTRSKTPASARVLEGETVLLRARIASGGAPLDLSGMSASFHWQTNGMSETQWWPAQAAVQIDSATGGVVSTRFTVPRAKTARWFFRLGDAGDDLNYTAYGALQVLPSPGAEPNALELPRRSLDFAAVAVTNAPWASSAEVDAAIAAALAGFEGGPGGGGVIEETDPVAMPALISHVGQRDNPHGVTAAQVGALGMSWPSTGTVYHATAAGSGSTWVTARDGSGWLLASGRAEGVAGDYDAIIVSEVFGEGYNGPAPGTVLMLSPSGAYTSGVWSIERTPPYGVYLSHAEPDRITWYAEGSIPDAASVELSPDVEDAIGTVSIAWYGTTEVEERLATESDVAGATNAVVASIFSLTNALLVVSNGVASVETNGVPVWSSASGGGSVPPSVTNELWLAISALQGTVAALQGEVAAQSHDWGRFAPDGSPNPDPDYMLFINSPATVWGAGYQWSVSGGHAVLTATGTVAFASGGSGALRIGPGDGANYFGYVEGGSVLVGAAPTGFSVDVPGETATIVYPYAGGDFPVLWFTPSLSAPFGAVGGVVWADNQDGSATVTAPATTQAGFWKATTAVAVGSTFTSTMPALFSGGVFGATNAPPVRYDSTIVITSGGQSYRIPAEAQ